MNNPGLIQARWNKRWWVPGRFPPCTAGNVVMAYRSETVC